MVAASNLTLDGIDYSLLDKATEIIQTALNEGKYNPPVKLDKDILTKEILGFLVAKILVVLINRLELKRKFLNMYKLSVFEYLKGEKEKEMQRAAEELNIQYDLPEKDGKTKDVSYAVTLSDYLRPEYEEIQDRLVNQKIERGKIFLDRARFMGLISKIAAQDLKKSMDSLPIDVETVPVKLKNAMKLIGEGFLQSARQQFSVSDFGSIAPEAFPPCMAKIYAELLNGVNVTHSGRFAIATFLASIGMPSEKIIGSFRRTPNFNEHTTRYQVERITGINGQKYSCPSCDKMRSYNLCVANCPVSHPVQFYSNETAKGKSAIEAK